MEKPPCELYKLTQLSWLGLFPVIPSEVLEKGIQEVLLYLKEYK